MSKSKLFSPISVGSLELRNRIVIAPMCQYSATDGVMSDWHMMHLGSLALSGAGALTIEATAVTPDGRISYGDVGLYSDDSQRAMGRVLEAIRTYSDIPVVLQLAHAGRKASSDLPWKGGLQIPPDSEGGWKTVAPSAVAYLPNFDVPEALDANGLKRIRDSFAASARRAAALGLDAIQVHAAHGYLLHEFLSPISNHRSDSYGGSLENRMRFPLEVYDAVREAFPAEKPVTIRISASDWVEGGWDIHESVEFAKALDQRGCSAIHVSSGGLSADQKIAVGPNYQVPFARAIKQAVRMPVVAVGMISEFEQAEAILSTGDADMIALARAIVYDPHWPWHAAAHFGEKIKIAKQYMRCHPRQFASLFEMMDR